MKAADKNSPERFKTLEKSIELYAALFVEAYMGNSIICQDYRTREPLNNQIRFRNMVLSKAKTTARGGRSDTAGNDRKKIAENEAERDGKGISRQVERPIFTEYDFQGPVLLTIEQKWTFRKNNPLRHLLKQAWFSESWSWSLCEEDREYQVDRNLVDQTQIEHAFIRFADLIILWRTSFAFNCDSHRYL